MSTARDVRRRLEPFLSKSDDDLVIDCCGLSFIDSSGVAVLSFVLQSLEAQGRRMRVTNADRTVEHILELLGLAEPLHVNDRPCLPPEPEDAEAGRATR